MSLRTSTPQDNTTPKEQQTPPPSNTSPEPSDSASPPPAAPSKRTSRKERRQALYTPAHEPPAVVALVRSAFDRACIASGTGTLARVTYCATANELLKSVERGTIPVILTEIRDAEGTSVKTILQKLATYQPAPILLLLLSLTPTDVREALGVVSTCAVRHLILRGTDDIAPSLREALQYAGTRGAGVEIQRTVTQHVPEPLQPFFNYCAFEATRPLTVSEVARATGFVRRTLESHLARAELLPPQEIIIWCRILHAGWRLSEAQGSIKAVVQELQFPSISSFYYQLKHYAGYTPISFLHDGGFPALLRQFARRIHIRGSERDEALRNRLSA